MEGDAPYRPPKAEVQDRRGLPPSEVEELRRAYLQTESSTRWIGLLIACVSVDAGAAVLRALVLQDAASPPGGSLASGGLLLAGLVLAAACGAGLLTLQRVAFTGTLLLCCCAPPLLWWKAHTWVALPLTIACAAFAYLLSRPHSRFVFSVTYEDAIQATPELSEGAGPRIVRGVLLLVACGVAVRIVAPLLR